MTFDPQELEEAFRELDKDGSGEIDFPEYLYLGGGKTISCCGDFWKWEMIQTFSDTMYVFSDIPLALS